MRATLGSLSELEIQIATLEAISDNEPAISLSANSVMKLSMVSYFQSRRCVERRDVRQPNGQTYFAKHSRALLVGQLEFYQESAPWQGHWQSLTRQNGNALIVSDSAGAAVGYALYKKSVMSKKFNEIALHQCVALPRADTEAIIGCALRSL